ncbi:MAG TPA: energy-coupling factor transporter transmembrane component T [Bacillota bacterium]|nr:energy-coupling factor transporter transmembrane component T [Bacillota bacterium]HPZ59265.1 energy-coupling factor transporter transmembrane component T [Bacillota bacterium]HQC82448.1 energy-coupling factor transporter transmembrane component T [Bacillota bacterium]
MKDTFSTYHPIINAIFFCAVICFSMVFLHPVFLAISMSGAFIYAVSLSGKRTLKFALLFLVPMMIVAGAVNPLFNHRGVTILRYMGDNPLTLESILYGVAIAIMFGSVILWFSCVHVIMTSDKLMYLFGRIIPSLSLMFSMVLRFVPKFKNQIRLISNSQKCIGRDISDGSLRQRAKHGIKIISIMISWALENAIDTADSMRSRGYGLPGRSSFAIYRFDGRDLRTLICLAVLILLVIAGGFAGENNIQYFPSIKTGSVTTMSLIVYAAYALLCYAPVIINVWEAIKWQRLQSKI